MTTEIHNPTDFRTLRDIIVGYTTAMLWAERDDEGEPLDDNYSVDDFAPETIDKIRATCERFAELVAPIDYQRATGASGDYSDEEYLGHDLWLTSRGHGVGFWEPGRWEILCDDGEYHPADGENSLLCVACYATAGRYGEGPYIGDDGLLYLP